MLRSLIILTALMPFLARPEILPTHLLCESRFNPLSLTIPANTSATVFVPANDSDTVTESGQAAQKSAGVTYLHSEPGAAVYQVSSGMYRFHSLYDFGH